ncbi:MAG: hypothetical protein LBM98_02605 [Oscillospiraceae bacterium]|nr:hypothetical protein [Oscillospiraceae bacterium]
MLRTCNIVRIAGLPVLRNDGQGDALPCSGALRRNGGRGYWAWIASRGSQ